MSKTTITHHLLAKWLFRRYARKKPFFQSTTTTKHLLVKCYYNFDWNRVLQSDETKIEVFGNEHWRWVWREKKDRYNEKNLIPNVKLCWRLCDIVGQKIASWTPRNIKIRLPLPGNENWDVIGSSSRSVIWRICPNQCKNSYLTTESSICCGAIESWRADLGC